MSGPEGNGELSFPRISMFPRTKSRETLRFEGSKIHCSPRDQSLSDLLYSKPNRSNRWKTNNHVIDKCRATAVNISRVTVNCFLFGVIVFAISPAHGIWRDTVSLLDVMGNELTNEWARCSGKNANYITKGNVRVTSSVIVFELANTEHRGIII